MSHAPQYTTYSFRIFIRRISTGYSAWAPSLPNLSAGTGSTKEKAIENLRAIWVEAAINWLYHSYVKKIPYNTSNPVAELPIPEGCTTEILTIQMNRKGHLTNAILDSIYAYDANIGITQQIDVAYDPTAFAWNGSVGLFSFTGGGKLDQGRYGYIGYPWPGAYEDAWVMCGELCYPVMTEDIRPIAPTPYLLCSFKWNRTTRHKPCWVLWAGPTNPWMMHPHVDARLSDIAGFGSVPNTYGLYIPYGNVFAEPGHLTPIMPPTWEHNTNNIGYHAVPSLDDTSENAWIDPNRIWISGYNTQESAPWYQCIYGVNATTETVQIDVYFTCHPNFWSWYKSNPSYNLNRLLVRPAFYVDRYALDVSSIKITQYAPTISCSDVVFSQSPSPSVSPSRSRSPSPSPSPGVELSPSAEPDVSPSPSNSASPSPEIVDAERAELLGGTYRVTAYRIDPISTTQSVASAVVGSSDWQNPSNRFDVLGDGVVDARDYQALQSYVSTNGYGLLPQKRSNGQPYVDINGDGQLTTADAEQLANYLAYGEVFDRRETETFSVDDFSAYFDIIDPTRITRALDAAAIVQALPRDDYQPMWLDCATRSVRLATYDDEVPWQSQLVFVNKILITPPHPYNQGCRTDPILDSALWPRLIARICDDLNIPEPSPSPLPPMDVPPAVIPNILGELINVVVLAIYDEADEYYVGSYPFYTEGNRITSAGREMFLEDRTYWEQTICLINERFDGLLRVRMGIIQPMRNKEVNGQWEIRCGRCEMPGDSDRIAIDHLRISAPNWPSKYRSPRITSSEITSFFETIVTPDYGQEWNPDFLLCLLDDSGSIRLADYSDALTTTKAELVLRYPELRIRPDVVTGKPERWLRTAAEALRLLLRLSLTDTPTVCLPRQYESFSPSPSEEAPSPSLSPSPSPGVATPETDAWYHPLSDLDFGTLPAGTGLRYTTSTGEIKTGYLRSVQIRNIGVVDGVAGTIVGSLTDTSPFHTTSYGSNLDLRVGESKPYYIMVDTSIAGEYELDLPWASERNSILPGPVSSPDGDPIRARAIIV